MLGEVNALTYKQQSKAGLKIKFSRAKSRMLSGPAAYIY